MTDSSAQSGTPMVSRFLAWRPLQSWQTVLAAGVSVLLAAVLSLVLIDRDLAAAPTVVTVATRADIKLADGTQHPAKIGSVVPRGATILTGRYGGVQLTTEGREVYVGALSRVQVLDGLHQVLDRGQVMIDTTEGPALTLATTAGAGTVSAAQEGLSRVEQNVGTLRLAVYRGEASITADGRRATTTVPALHQVRVPYFGVPEPQTALALTVKDGVYDVWEQRLAANLVQADIDLNSFATGLNGVDGTYVLNAAPVSLRESAFVGRTRGEQALAVAVAQKARLFDDAQANLAEVERDRSGGGSWGVVAAIVQARVTDVTSVLGTSLDDQTDSGTLASGPVSSGQRTPTPSTSGGGKPTPAPTKSPSVRPTTPTPSPSSPIDEAIKQVTHAVPSTPPATPTSSPAPSTPGGPLANLVGSLLKPLVP